MPTLPNRSADVSERREAWNWGETLGLSGLPSLIPLGVFASLTPDEIFADHVTPLGIPAWHGAMIGHGHSQWTLPVGLPVTIDADIGTLRFSGPGVA